MAARTVDPGTIKTLRDWAARWPKAGNLAFDEKNRNPVVYTRSAPMAQVKEIPWKREGDTLTILTQRDGFSAGAVSAAERRMGRYREQRETIVEAATEQLRAAEEALLEAWREYREAGDTPGGREALLRDVMIAERALNELEEETAAQLYAGRKSVSIAITQKSAYTAVQVPPMLPVVRGMALAEIGDSQ